MSEQKPKLTIRCDDDEQMERWKEAAHIRRASLSEWVRKVLDATAQRTIEGDTRTHID